MKVYSYKSKDKEPQSKRKSFAWKKLWFLNIKKLTFRQIAVLAFRLFAVGIFFIAILFLYYSKDLPDPGKLLERQVSESTKIYASDGSLLYEIHGEEKRTLVKLNEISDYLKHATISAEDKDFYKHHGISYTGILRSVFRYVTNLGTAQGGGSTITQQFVKNAILNNKKSLDRKLREVILSVALETKFSKDQILEFYLNEIPYGRNAYGSEAAALTFFGKSAKDLTLAESAYLASLPQRTSYFEPYGTHREALDNRKNYVLGRMLEDGYITKEQEEQAKNEKVEFKKSRTALIAPHFVLMVQSYLSEKYGAKSLEEGGLKVYTTLNPKLQEIAEKAVKEGVEKNSKKYKANNAALVAIDPKTGQILAMVGGKDYFGKSEPEGCVPGKNCTFEPNVNVATSEKQPGSSFKPYVYVTAFGKDYKYGPGSILMDVITNFGKFGDSDYIPYNYDGKERGPITIRKSLAGSLNIPAVKILALVGVENAVQTARNLGITSPLQNCGLSLVLGGCDVRLIDHVGAYSVLANGGVKNEKTSILKIIDKSGNILEEYKESPKQVLDPEAVYLLTNIMTDDSARAYVFGAGSALTLPGRPVAAKTGTTQKWKDGWTMGFTPSLAAGVWAGNNNSEKMADGADGVYVAAPIWNAFMKQALKDTPVEEFKRPAGIQTITLDDASGKLPTANSPQTREDIFASYSVPQETDSVHQPFAFDSVTGQPANSNTPPGQIIYKLFTIFHSEFPNNPNWENPVREWAEKNGFPYPPTEAQTQTPDQNYSQEIPSIDFAEPKEGQIISTIPFLVQLNSYGRNPLTRIEISLDGELNRILDFAPYSFNLTKENLTPGTHTLAAKAIDFLGNSQTTSIQFKYQP